MTEGYEVTWLVRVRAQVMCRDEATGGWMTDAAGGLSHVMLARRTPIPDPESGTGEEVSSHSHAPSLEYFISGTRISDEAEVLWCTIKKDFKYWKVMPTFHHWVTGEKRFGLTFQTAADARAFDRGVRTAVAELYDAAEQSRATDATEPVMQQPTSQPPANGIAGPRSSVRSYKKHFTARDDEQTRIFECLNLPTDSRSSSENSTSSRRKVLDTQTPILSAISMPSQRSDSSSDTSLKQFVASGAEDDRGVEDTNPDHCPYVHLTAVHDYTYPQVGSTGPDKSSLSAKPSLLSRDSGSIKKGVCSLTEGPPPLPDKSTKPDMPTRMKCRHCHEWYLATPVPAPCQFAPDYCKGCIDALTCIKCAQCMLYHCMSDAEGDFAMNPCSCAPPSHDCFIRWTGLAILSMFVPCLCCYVPLQAFRKAACPRRPHRPVQ